jgi:type VI secretion system protein ImpL
LRERFEEGVGTLKKHRRAGHSLYELPWYIIIGAPGSGKTTALVNSGLKFPLETGVGRNALKGVGGTRNCDWWFTDEAVFLDTAGRYTTQDSDATSDAAGWAEFLALLRKYRKRRPINGVILTISAKDLMVQGDMSREAHIDATRKRLTELNKELRIQLPVYVMVTKCDLVAGFTEYFDDLDHEGRAQVWGVTFNYEHTLRGDAALALPAEFDALMARLNERLLVRIDHERDYRRRTKVFAFPQQVAALRDALVQFITDVFTSTRFDARVLLRGVYFTSGTQEGTPIDRLLGTIGRSFGVASEMVSPTPGRGKAYFVSRLLKDVVIGESGLAGVNTRGELQKAALQLGAYAAAVLIAVFGFGALTVSHARNQNYLVQAAESLTELQKVEKVTLDSPPEDLLARLNGVRRVVEVTNQYRDQVPTAMRWGLYQGSSVGNAARDAYVRELDGVLYPLVAERFKERLIGYRSEPEKLYEYLKAYLMVGEPKRIDESHLQYLADLEWGADQNSTTPTLATHFKSFLDYTETLRPIPLDAALVTQSRNTIRQASVPRLVYGRLQRRYAGDTARAVRLDVSAGAGSADVMRRRSGVSLSEPIPSVYSRAVFSEATGVRSIELVKQFAVDDWVWGETGSFANNPLRLASEVIDIYERDYIAAWNAVLNDLELVPFATLGQAAKSLELLSGPGSPLRGLVATVVEHTNLVSTAEGAKEQGGLASTGKKIQEQVGKILTPLKEAAGASTVPAGSLITAHFQPLHRLLEGEPGSTPLDRILTKINQVQVQLRTLGPAVGGTDPIVALSDPKLREILQSLQQDALTLPPAIRSLVSQIGQRAEVSVVSGAASDIEGRYRDDVLRECSAIVDGRYPFVPGSPRDVPLADFGRLFGYDGIFDRFFRSNLESLVDTSRRPWSWRPGTGNLSTGMLSRFEAAHRLREVFFRPNSLVPGMRFTAMLSDYDSGATRFTLEVDGQVLDSRQGPNRTWTLAWPGPNPGLASVTFEQRFGGRPTRSYHGPWAWFRMVDDATTQRDSDVRNVLTLRAESLQGRVIVDAGTIRNPFANLEWQRFRCEP